MTTTDTDRRTLRLVYVGQRLDTGRRLQHAWQVEGETTLSLWGKMVGDRIGAVYEVQATSDGTSVYPGTLTLVQDVVGTPGPLLAEWSADDRASRTQAADEARRRALKGKPDPIAELCAPLRGLVRKQVGWARRAALIAAIIEEVSS